MKAGRTFIMVLRIDSKRPAARAISAGDGETPSRGRADAVRVDRLGELNVRRKDHGPAT